MGRQVSDLLTQAGASHLMMTVKELGTKGFATMENTNLTVHQGVGDNQENTKTKIRINFYASKLLDSTKKTFAYCLVLQPII